MTNHYLFSIDLEDVRDYIPDGHQYKNNLEHNTLLYLDFLNKNKAKTTFFIVGSTAKSNPDLIREIITQGHEIACHGQHHIQLNKLTSEEFKKDLIQNKKTLLSLGAKEVIGFRAPTFSLTKNESWVYEILTDLGFQYSSSVLPAKNPLFGWKEFGEVPKKVGDILEIPITLFSTPFLSVPFGGGIYFRTLPFPLTQYLFKKRKKNNKAVLGYFHPYDLDSDQEKFMHPDINNNWFYNELMYLNRSKTIPRLQKIINLGWTIIPYKDYLKLHG